MRAARLYLRLGDRCYHVSREEWGLGSVVEEMTSTIEGGTCLIRVLFEDGSQRTFNNDLDSEMCCYFMGLRQTGSQISMTRPVSLVTAESERHAIVPTNFVPVAVSYEGDMQAQLRPVAMKRCLNNLLDNALRHGRKVEIAAARH